MSGGLKRRNPKKGSMPGTRTYPTEGGSGHYTPVRQVVPYGTPASEMDLREIRCAHCGFIIEDWAAEAVCPACGSDNPRALRPGRE